jgi:hypothetical protein
MSAIDRGAGAENYAIALGEHDPHAGRHVCARRSTVANYVV